MGVWLKPLSLSAQSVSCDCHSASFASMGCQSSKGADSALLSPKRSSTPTPQSDTPPSTPPKTLLDNPEGKREAGRASAPIVSELVDARRSSFLSSGSSSEEGSNASSSLNRGHSFLDVSSIRPADIVHSHASRRGLKQRTFCTASKELDIMVVGFTSHDNAVGSALGRNCKQKRWSVMYDREAPPIEIKLHVQEHKLHSNEVRIECDGESIFQGAGLRAKSRLTEDFHYEWSFRGTIQGINEPNYFEVHPAHVANYGGEPWFPATITAQREDGHFEVVAQETDANGRIIEVTYPAVHKVNLREAASKKPLAVPENTLRLDVPKSDPLKAVLSLANGDHDITHHFGRPSPAVTAAERNSQLSLEFSKADSWTSNGSHMPSPAVTAAEPNSQLSLKVSKDRSKVTANAGHQVLSHFASGEVQAKTCEVAKLKHSWTVQLGPFAEHTIEISKRHALGKVVTLSVDGDILVESAGADIGCTVVPQDPLLANRTKGNEWQCKFRLAGERVLDFEVFKTNADGVALEETGHVQEKRKYAHECIVNIPNDWDFSTACLLIDETPFAELPTEPEKCMEVPQATLPILQRPTTVGCRCNAEWWLCRCIRSVGRVSRRSDEDGKGEVAGGDGSREAEE